MKELQWKLIGVLDQMIADQRESLLLSLDAAYYLKYLTAANPDLSACDFAKLWRKASSEAVSASLMRHVKKRAMDEATGLARIRWAKVQDEGAVLFRR